MNTTPDEMLSPSQVFGARLRETRRARGMSQEALAERMSAVGRPIGRPALLRIEKGTRGVSLDEALALAECLAAVPANLLSPPDGSWLALTEKAGVDAAGLRNWLITGDAINAWPATPQEEDRATLDAILSESLSRYAQALIDANRAGDRAGQATASRAMEEAIDRHRAALAAIERNTERDALIAHLDELAATRGEAPAPPDFSERAPDLTITIGPKRLGESDTEDEPTGQRSRRGEDG